MNATKPHRRTHPTPAVADSRKVAATVRVALALLGVLLVILGGHAYPHARLLLLGFTVVACTGGLLRFQPSDRWLRIEEPIASLGGVLIVTCGPDRVGGLTLLWLVCVASGVVARGGRVTESGRVMIVAVLASPLIRFGFTSEWVSLFAGGLGMLLVIGRISVETSDLLRDQLTGAVSRAAFNEQVTRYVRRASLDEPVGLIMLDLDDFGVVNKRVGHAAGDDVLVRTVLCVEANLRAQDVIGRIGGDEFAILTLASEPEMLVSRILVALDEIGIDVTAGLARSPHDAGEPSSLFAVADTALRVAKQRGKRQWASHDARVSAV